MAAITLEELLKEVGVCSEKLNDSISDDHIREIALFLTSWRTVATYLGLRESDLDAVEQEKDEQMKKLKALQKWKGKFDFKATYRKLVEVLLSLAMADVAEKVCDLLKGITDSHRAATEAQLQEKDAEIERLQQELKSLRKDTQLQQKDSQLQQQGAELQERTLQLNRQLREVQTLTEERGRLQIEMEAKQREIQALRGQNTAKAESLAAVQSRLQQLQGEMNVRCAQVQQQLRERDAELNRLRRELRDQTTSRNGSLASMWPPPKKPKQCSPSELRLTCRRLQDMTLPVALSSPYSVTVDTMVYVTHCGNPVIHKYDPQTEEWSELPEYQYWGFTMTGVNNELVLVGGQDKPTWDKYRLNQPMVRDAVAVYSASQKSWEQPYPPMNTPRYQPAAATYHHHLVVAGGWDSGDLATVEILNTLTPHSQWLSITSMSLPVRCNQMLSAIVHDTLYLLGGTLGRKVLSVSLSALTQTDKPPKQWHSLPDAPLDNASIVGVHGSLLIIGGRNQAFQVSSAIHIYNQKKNAWNKVGDLPTARSSCACCLLPSGEILIAGGLGHDKEWTKRMDMAAVTVWD